MDAARLYEIGVASLLRGDLATACRALADAAAQWPEAVEIQTALGHALSARADHVAALCAYRRACSLAPKSPSVFSDLAEALRTTGALGEAESAARQALSLDADHPAALNNMGVIALERGRPQDALDHLERLVRIEPESPIAHGNRARALQALGDFSAAVSGWRRVVAIEGANASGSSLANLALALHQAGSARASTATLPEVISLLERARELEPTRTVIRTNLASALFIAGHLERARDELEAVSGIEAEDGATCALLYQIGARLADWDHMRSVAAALDRANEAALSRGAPTPEAPLSHVARCEDARENLRIAAAWSADAARRAQAAATDFAPARRQRRAGARLRLGYLSGDFREHPIAHLIAGVIRDHDRERFAVRTYATASPDASDVRARIVAASDAHVELAGADFAGAAQRIREDRIDVLIDLSTHTESTRLEIAALRPAPVQASYLGFPGSTGADFFDYAIADAVVVPEEAAAHYSETVIRLPHCYQAFDPAQPVARVPERSAWGLPDFATVLACFAKASKLDAEMFAVWLELLRALPGTVLWLLDDHDARDRLEAYARRAGIDPARLVFATRTSRPEHLARLTLADVVLDTRTYNGHTTTSDAVFCGVPVVALEGRHFASRVSSSILRAADCAETVARDLESYRSIALELARSEPARSALRTKLRARQSPYFDRRAFLEALESAYLAMSERNAR